MLIITEQIDIKEKLFDIFICYLPNLLHNRSNNINKLNHKITKIYLSNILWMHKSIGTLE